MIAFISDIHSNLPALEAVFKDIDSLGEVERIYCLGDVIGYGPHPIECMEMVADRCSLVLMGNHEHAVLHGPYLFNPNARRAIEWTRDTVKNDSIPAKRKLIWELLENLPTKHEVDDVMLVHASPRDPVMEYVLESDLWEGADPNKMDEIFAGFQRLCFVGHTHRPGIFTEDKCFLAASETSGGFDVSDGHKYLINVGSVGQPRDRDPRSCYCLFTGDAIYFRRVSYDIDRTARDIRRNEALGERLASRLFKGE